MTEAARPEVRLDVAVRRPASLGPFPSARDGAKFLAYAAVGALVAGVASPWLFVPFVAFGFVASVHRADEKAPDRRLVDRVAWEVRRHSHPRPAARRPRLVAGGAVVELAPGRSVAVVRAGGVAVAFLPPGAAQALFHEYRTLLQSLSTDVGMAVGGRRLPTQRLIPTHHLVDGPERTARDGYAAMMGLLTEHRRTRHVLVVLSARDPGRAGRHQLDRAAGAFVSALDGMGVPAARVRGAALLRLGLRLRDRLEVAA
ncbi:MAG TPA: hypothetical protein VFF67_00685 [Thermoplasmata archaeon]|nr:hypothetical protein [Thermoplasmata archaeon]